MPATLGTISAQATSSLSFKERKEKKRKGKIKDDENKTKQNISLKLQLLCERGLGEGRCLPHITSHHITCLSLARRTREITALVRLRDV
jgi:hypothetical protein